MLVFIRNIAVFTVCVGTLSGCTSYKSAEQSAKEEFMNQDEENKKAFSAMAEHIIDSCLNKREQGKTNYLKSAICANNIMITAMSIRNYPGMENLSRLATQRVTLSEKLDNREISYSTAFTLWTGELNLMNARLPYDACHYSVQFNILNSDTRADINGNKECWLLPWSQLQF